jgi:4'-phosphopantetheinyl transferase EntD
MAGLALAQRRPGLLNSRAMHPDATPTIPSLLHAQRLHCRAGSAEVPIHLLRYDLQRYDPAAFAQAGVAYPPAMDRCVPKRQAEYLFGRVAARRALADVGWPDAQVGTGSQREPLWPEKIVGAITHTDTYAAATAVRAGRFRGIGIDIEAALAPEAMASTEHYALNAGEREVLRAQAALAYPLALAIAFSAKESIYKALFPTVGRYFGFEAVRIDAIDAIDAEQGTLHFTVMEDLCPDWRAGHRDHAHFTLLDPRTILTSYGW